VCNVGGVEEQACALNPPPSVFILFLTQFTYYHVKSFISKNNKFASRTVNIF
jgi:hypothetical protein